MIRPPSTSRLQAAARGRQAEARALDYLTQQGLQLVDRNYSCRWGEIDLIMRHKQTLVFIEVRHRSHNAYGDAAASVSLAKQTRIWRTAEHYLQRCAPLPPCRFDLVAFDGDQISWLQNVMQR
jgi:putative endonuclease